MNNWTYEMLDVMLDALIQRRKAIADSFKGKTKISDTELFSRMGKSVKYGH